MGIADHENVICKKLGMSLQDLKKLISLYSSRLQDKNTLKAFIELAGRL